MSRLRFTAAPCLVLLVAFAATASAAPGDRTVSQGNSSYSIHPEPPRSSTWVPEEPMSGAYRSGANVPLKVWSATGRLRARELRPGDPLPLVSIACAQRRLKTGSKAVSCVDATGGAVFHEPDGVEGAYSLRTSVEWTQSCFDVTNVRATPAQLRLAERTWERVVTRRGEAIVPKDSGLLLTVLSRRSQSRRVELPRKPVRFDASEETFLQGEAILPRFEERTENIPLIVPLNEQGRPEKSFAALLSLGSGYGTPKEYVYRRLRALDVDPLPPELRALVLYNLAVTSFDARDERGGAAAVARLEETLGDPALSEGLRAVVRHPLTTLRKLASGDEVLEHPCTGFGSLR